MVFDNVCNVYTPVLRLCSTAAELSSSSRWIIIFSELTVAAADEAPSHIIPHDYT